jgi:hypothetical protein
MSYSANTTREFDDGFKALPKYIRTHAKITIQKLLNNPNLNSYPNLYPFPGRYEHKPPPVDADGCRHTFTILFHFNADGASLDLAGIGCEVEVLPP